ncbi:hypothetical protein OHA79_05155 [Streptomyces sp. NBC_00841]|uniref:hypothetical protein n=1 Tax=unclassified Streptomyces TaxID=2593676 RepID=UPI00224D4542|nr:MULTISPECIES: hypothetical protein [unclassified Streptomyces]MCX4537465.1 hypothetical protein [Streptomyces sp. NBC_01669]WRZ97316.1 hypothetical protein OHA79_05155 [Streptomyces sp. NBC_00841]
MRSTARALLAWWAAKPTSIDRIFDEAHETADPVHRVRVFGIALETAMKYVKAARPHRFIKDPTQP